MENWSRTDANKSYSTDVNFIASQAIARSQEQRRAQEVGQQEGEEESKERADAMAALERQARAPMGFVAASTGPEGGVRAPPADQQPPPPAQPVNPDAIDLDDDMDAE
jgi:pre-mRNA-splicing factor SYF1